LIAIRAAFLGGDRQAVRPQARAPFACGDVRGEFDETHGARVAQNLMQKKDETKFVRADWVAASRFHDHSVREVLGRVADQVSHWIADGRPSHRPLVLLDLDSTLYEVGSRTEAILKDWIQSESAREFPEVTEAIARDLRLGHVGYSLRDTFRALGIADYGPAFESAKRYWGREFFTSRRLPHDRVYPGAVAFVRNLYELGAHLVYLTGRDEPGMGQGTRERLVSDGFPFGLVRTELLLKPSPEMDDLTHKLRSNEYVSKHGHLVASFENEPKNLVALYDLFPEAMHVLLETAASDHPAEPREGLYRIRGFVD